VLSFPQSASPIDAEFYEVLKDVASRSDPGAKVTTPLLSGFTDCHFFREKEVPCYGFMPLKVPIKELGGIHGNDERISVENVKLGTRLMYDIVRRMATQ